MTRVNVDPTASLPVPQPRARTTRDETAAPRDNFSAMIDDTEPRRPDPARSQAAGKADRQKAGDASRKDDANARTDQMADQTKASAQVGDAAPVADATATTAQTAEPAQASADFIVDAAATTDATAAAVTTPAAPGVPLIIPQIVTAAPAPAPAESGPLSIAAAALAATAASVEAGKPQTQGVPDVATDATATGNPAIAEAVAKTSAKPASKTASLDAPKTDDTDASATPAQSASTSAVPQAATKSEAAAHAATPDGAAADTPVAPAPRERQASVTATLDAAPQSFTPTQALPQHGSSAIPVPSQVSVVASQTAPVPLNGLAMQIAATASSGKTSFEIRLDPAELGRIDVRLEVDRQGNVTSHLTVEKPETLAMLRQDAPQLQRALNDAGLQTSDKGMQFSLSDQSLSGQSNNPNRNSGDNNRAMQRLVIADDDNLSIASAGRSYGRMLASSSGVDIRV